MVVLRHEAPVDTRHSLIAYSIQQGLDVLVEDFAFEGKVKARHRERQTRTHRNKYHVLRSAGYDGTTRAGPGQDGRRRARVEETRNK